MRTGILIFAGALAASAGLAAAQAPPARSPPLPVTPVPRESLFATPRYYGVKASGDAGRMDGARICVGGEGFSKMFGGFAETVRKDPQALAALNKGCTSKHERRDDGSFSMERTCDAAAGAPFTMRMTVSGSTNDIQQHMEMTLKGAGPDGRDRTSVMDERLTYLGACPAKVKPGEILEPDGTVFDFATARAHGPKETAGRKGAPVR